MISIIILSVGTKLETHDAFNNLSSLPAPTSYSFSPKSLANKLNKDSPSFYSFDKLSHQIIT